MGKFAAYLNAALALAWLALFFTNDALFVSHEVDLSDHLRGDAFAMAWAGSAICSRLYIALVNYGVELRYALREPPTARGPALPDASRRRSHCVRPRPRGISACRSSAGISSPPEQQEEMRADDRQAAVRARAGRLCPSVSSQVSPLLDCCAFYRSGLLIVLSSAERAPSASPSASTGPARAAFLARR